MTRFRRIFRTATGSTMYAVVEDTTRNKVTVYGWGPDSSSTGDLAVRVVWEHTCQDFTERRQALPQAVSIAQAAAFNDNESRSRYGR